MNFVKSPSELRVLDKLNSNHDSIGPRNVQRLSVRRFVLYVAVIFAMTGSNRAFGQTYNVGSSSDLYNAIQSIDTNVIPNTVFTINLNANVTMGQQVLDFNGNANVLINGNSNTIDGANQFQPLVIDNGIVVLQSLNLANTGSPITINGGTLIDTTGTLQAPIVANGTMFFNESSNVNYGGTLSGTGTVEIGGAGSVTLSGTNTFTGLTVIDSNGSLAATTSSLLGDVQNHSVLVFSQATAGIYAGNISGDGGVAIDGKGEVIFTGTNTYTGSTYVTVGSGLSGTTANIQGLIYNDGNIQFNQATNGTYAGKMTGIGGVDITGGGTILFTGLNDYQGGTTVDSGSTLVGSTSSLQGQFFNNGSVQFNQAGSGVYSGDMSGAGGVRITGGASILFSGTNSYTGGTIVDSLNSLTGTTSSVQAAITNNGFVEFNQSTAGSYKGNMSGSGSVEITGGGALTFSGTNTYSGGTLIDVNSTLIGSTAAIQGGITNKGAVQFNQTGNGTYAGNMTGTGSVEISSGVVTFSGTNSYTGATTVDSTAMLIGSTTGVQGDVTNNGRLKFVDNASPSGAGSGSVSLLTTSHLNVPGYGNMVFGPFGNTTQTANVYSGNMTGSGTVEIGGTGVTTFTGTNSYSGGTTVDSGSALVGSTTSLQGNIANNGFIQFNNGYGTSLIAPTLSQGAFVLVPDIIAGASPSLGAPGTYGGNLSGNGAVEISGTGPIVFTGNNTYKGGTFVDGGSLLVGTTNSLQGLFINNGVVDFNQTYIGAYTGNMSGAGSVDINGIGAVTFLGRNTYTGGTSVNTGSMLIGTTSSLQGSIFDKGTVQFNQTTAGTFAGVISGTGGVEIAGVGPLTFSGANKYTGATTIDNGSTLIVSSTGSIAGNVNVNNGGTFMGQGTVGNVTVNAGGTIYPGTVGAPMSVNGNFKQNVGSTYTAELSPTASDKIIATGTAQISTGTTLNLVVDSGTYTVGSKYQLLTAAGGLTGTYANTMTSSYSQNIVFAEQYDANNLQLVVNSNLLGSAQTSNQISLASVLDQASGSATGDFANAITQMTTLNPGQLSSALNQVSGDIYPSLSAIERQTATAQMQLLSNRLAGLSGPGIPAVGVAQRPGNIRFVSRQAADPTSPDGSSVPSGSRSLNWTSWGQGYGIGGNIAGDGNAGGVNYGLGGTLFGAERWLSDSLMIGALGGYNATSVSDHQSGSSAQINTYQVGLYEHFRGDTLYFSNIDTLGNNNYSVSRPLNFGTVQETASSKSSGNQWTHYSELGRTIDIDDLRLQPFAGVQYMYLDQQGFSENGAGSLDLTAGSQTVNSVRNGFGARLYQETMWGNILVIPALTARYQHEWGNGTQLITSSLSGAPTAQFVTSGTHTGRDFGLFTLSATAFLSDQFSLYGMVDAQVASSYYGIVGSAGIRYSW